MARVTVEDCLDKVDTRFSLVLLVAKRAKQLLRGASPTHAVKDNKYIVNALREVAGGTVSFDTGEVNVVEQIQADLNR